MELVERPDGTLYLRDTSPRGLLAERALSGHWRLKREGAEVVLDHWGVLRFKTEVHRCPNCSLWYDTYEMSKGVVYCKKCWKDYQSWRGGQSGRSIRTFRPKYLAGELAVSPPEQWDTTNPPPEES
jgi:hypothetical protein